MHEVVQTTPVIPEQQLQQTEHGLVATGPGWFVLNATDARWRDRKGRGFLCDFEGDSSFPQLGINLQVLAPGEPMAMYHWEADQEDFLVVDGEAVLFVEGHERPLRRWDFVHCPAGASHTIVGAGNGPCVVIAVGARVDSTGPDWGGYAVDEAAQRHGAGMDEETSDPERAYARFPPPEHTRYPGGLLPD